MGWAVGLRTWTAGVETVPLLPSPPLEITEELFTLSSQNSTQHASVMEGPKLTEDRRQWAEVAPHLH
jgi:hypothetical protein